MQPLVQPLARQSALNCALNRALSRGAVCAVVLLALTMAAGCARHTASSATYTYAQAQREQVVRMGTVLSVRPVTIQDEGGNPLGTIAGAVLGGVAGNAVGGGSGRNIATAGGAILGGILGDAAQHEMNRTAGLEIVVQLDSGETRVVAQAADVQLFAGQRVGLVSGGGPTRVVPMQQ